MSCYRRVTAWGLVFPSLLPPTSVKPLSGRPLVPLLLTLAEVHCTVTATARVLLDVCWKVTRHGAGHACKHPGLLSQGTPDANCSRVKQQRFVEYETVLQKELYLSLSLCSLKISVVANSFLKCYLLKPLLQKSLTDFRIPRGIKR